MNPLVNTSSTESRIRELMYEPLLAVTPRAQSNRASQSLGKCPKIGKLYTFKLRKNVKFHNGKEMTADDIKFALDYTLNPKNGAYGFEDLNAVERAEVADKYTLKIYMKHHNPLLPTVLTEIRSFSAIPNESLPEGLRKPATFPPGTGPFKFVEWQPGQRIVFERNDDYWGHKAYVDRVIMKEIGDNTVRFTALQAGDVDMIERTPYEWVQQIIQGKVKGHRCCQSGARRRAQSGIQRRRSAFQQQETSSSDSPRHRSEGNHAGGLLRLGRHGRPALSERPLSGISRMCRRRASMPIRAKALLKEAGYKGETLELMGNRGEVADIEGAAIQAQLKRIGVKVELKILERASALEIRRQGKYMFKLAGGCDYPDPLPAYEEYACEPNLRNRRLNESGYCDKDYDALLRKAEGEVDLEKRKAIFKQVVAKLTDDLPILRYRFHAAIFHVPQPYKRLRHQRQRRILSLGAPA